jgi:clan AA aspartic protease (TIGR02281 family)
MQAAAAEGASDEPANKPAASENIPRQPAELLAAKGLRKSGDAYLLTGESELSKLLKEARALQRKAFDANAQLEAANAMEVQRQRTIVELLEQRRQLRQVLQATNNVKDYNNIVNLMNEAGDRVRILQESSDVKNAVADAQNNAAAARDKYTECLLKMRRLADATSETYADLAADPRVKAALESLGRQAKKALVLGPSAGFKRNLLNLKKLEDVVLAETIKLRRERSDTFCVQVVFDDHYSKELTIDTGSSLIALPWKMALDLNLKPKESDQTIVLKLADGREIPAKMVIAGSVRVGKFVVEDVPCAVMSEELNDAVAVLGMSFLKNFSYHINSQDATLALTKIEAPTNKRAKASKAKERDKPDAAG